MTEHDHDREPDGIEQRIRQWGRRAPSTDAAIAARRVVARLGERRARRRWVLPVALAGAASLAGVAAWFTPREPRHLERPRAEVDELAPLPENVVLFWLDSLTPVYFVTGPPSRADRGLP